MTTDQDKFIPCEGGCSHTQEEHEAFDDGLIAGESKLAWIEKHGIKTHWSKLKGDSPCWAIVPLEEDKDRCFAECMAHNARMYEEFQGLGKGNTLDEALIDLARQRGMKTWEETP